MRIIFPVLCLFLCVAAVKKKTYYDATCPECKTLYHWLECKKERVTGSSSVSNGLMEHVAIELKCPHRHKFTSYTERFVEQPPPATLSGSTPAVQASPKPTKKRK